MQHALHSHVLTRKLYNTHEYLGAYMYPDREALLEAVNRLVTDEGANHLYMILTEVIPMARRLGVRLHGDNAVLNPLVDLAVDHPTQYANVMNLVETKRSARGLPPLDDARTKDDQFDKTDYMRDFMQQKRLRERKAAEIENMMRPDSAKLIGRTRLDYMQAQSNKWKKQRDELLAKARKEHGRLTKEQMNALLKGFWQRIDDELEELEALARAELQKPAHQRGKVVAAAGKK